MNPKLASLKDNEEEMKKCQESPLYFYNTYMLKEGQRPMQQQEYDLLVKQMELYRNSVPVRMRRGNYVFMKPIEAGKLPEYFDNSKHNRLLTDEFGQTGNIRNIPFPELLPKPTITDSGIAMEMALQAENVIFGKPKYNMGVDCHNGNAAFVVMGKDGKVMEYGNGKDDERFRAEVERVAKYYNIQPSEILKETN